MKRILITLTIVFGVLALGTAPSGATSFPVISGHLTDADGLPLQNVAIYANSGTLTTDTCTDANGFYKLQAKANQAKVYVDVRGGTSSAPKGSVVFAQGCREGSLQTWYISGRAVVKTATSNLTLDFQAPKSHILKLSVVDDTGAPVYGARVLSNSSLAYEGFIGESLDAKQHNFWWAGETREDQTTSTNGIAIYGLFSVASSKEQVDAYCSTVGAAECGEGDGVTEMSRYINENSFIVFYNPRPGVQQQDAFNVDWTTYTGQVVVPQVPSLDTIAPASAKVGSTVSVTSVAAISSAILTSSFHPKQSAKKSVFLGKKSNLFARSYAKPSKPGKWVKVGTCTYDGAGKCKVAYKMSGTAQIQFRPIGFSSILRTKTISKK
jgi:hypothetical protein